MSDLIETLTWACRIAYDTDDSDISPRYSKALSLLSDRSTLLWALLEEMAGEVVEVNNSATGGVEYKIGPSVWAMLTGNTYKTRPEARNNVLPIGAPANLEGVVRMAACLARAIQEQRKRREVSGE